LFESPITQLQKVSEMAKTEPVTTIEVQESLTDVLYLTNQGQMPSEIKRLLKQKELSFSTLAIDEFAEIGHRLNLIGTVIIDAESLDVLQQQKLARIIESLEMKNVSTILLSSRTESPVKSFSLAPVKSFSLVDKMESVRIDELWTKISTSLAFRKRGSGTAAEPVFPPTPIQNSNNNRVAEELSVIEALVDNLSEQLRLASLVQHDFLPTQLPNCDRLRWSTVFLPVEWVSGDIYDIVRIDEQHVGFYVADVVGHGMPAALLTIFLKQALIMRETIGSNYKIFSPAEVMKNLNLRMTGQKLSGNQFATCCYCLLNIKTLQLTYTRAGHPYPILIRGQEQPQQLEIQGSLLGIFEQAEFPQRTIQLQGGAKLLLYSDGVEPFIGSFGDLTGFSFSREFCEIKDLPIVEMMDKFNLLVQNQLLPATSRGNPAEVDDITIVGLEIA